VTSSRRGWLLPVLAFVVTVTAVLQTAVVPVLHPIGEALHASASGVGWVVTANLLAAAVLTPVLGRLGDVHGRRTALLGILAAVAAGSLLAALTTSLPLLVAARVLQGAAFGLFPLSIGILRDELPAERLTGAMAVVSGTLGAGGGLGLVLTGLLTRGGGDYHRVFWLALGVALLALLLAAVVVPGRPRTRGAQGGVDWLGGGVLGASLVLLLLPLSKGGQWGWASPATLGCLVASAVVFYGWVVLEHRVAAPLVTPVLMANRPLLVTNAAGLFVGLAMFISFLGVSDFVQTPASTGYGFSASVLSASAGYLLPGALAGVLAAPLGGRLVRRVGGRVVLVLAALTGAAGFVLMALLHSASWQLITGSLLVNVAVSLAFAAMPALIVAEVPPWQTGVANSVNSISRSIGSAVASALVVTLLASDVLPSGLPRESAYVGAFAIGAAGCLLAALLVAVGLPRLPRPDEQEAQIEAATALAGEWGVVGARA